MQFAILLSILLLNPILARSGITQRPVEYVAGGLRLKGYIAYDEGVKEKRPGVLVVHEWWGHDEHARTRAEMLAELGYVALAVDMYGDGKEAGHPDDAGKFSSEVLKNMPVMKARFMAALDELKREPKVDSTRIAAIGYCFGGSVVLNMARAGTDLKGVISFHGGLKPLIAIEKGKVKAKVLVCHGADDSFVSEEDIKGFKDEMSAAGVNYKFISYPGAIHSFTNPSATELGKKFGLHIAYSETADKNSWTDMQEFLKEIFRK